jgi:ABC-type sugar transport system substrate-binding protein
MIFMVPKFTGAAYFAATEKGAKEAVAELKGRGVAIDFLYTGPSVANTDEEIRMIDDLVAQKPDAIIIAANHADAMVPVAKKAKTSGIKVITYDADVADPTARQWFVNQGTFTLVGAALVDVVAEQAGASARFAVVSTDPGLHRFPLRSPNTAIGCSRPWRRLAGSGLLATRLPASGPPATRLRRSGLPSPGRLRATSAWRSA